MYLLYVVQSKLKRVLYQMDFRAQARRTSTDTGNTCNGERRGTSMERWFGRVGGGEEGGVKRRRGV